MKTAQKGMLAGSETYFHTPAVLSKRMFFYPLCTGHFFCDGNYRVARKNYDSFLILFVQSGEGFAWQDGREVRLRAGSAAFLDCYRPHRYRTEKGWEIYWLHFDGVLARAYYEQAVQNGFLFAPGTFEEAAECLRDIFSGFHAHENACEAVLSLRITGLLTKLLISQGGNVPPPRKAMLTEKTLRYISNHAAEPLSLSRLARSANLSEFHFTRVFRRETGFTPHQYVLQARVNLAKYYLKTTDLTLKEIAAQSGLGSESSFCTAFRRATGMTPRAYRSGTSPAQNNSEF
jgi:AraC family transcriptional regulator